MTKIVEIVGPDGAGKSTLCETVAALFGVPVRKAPSDTSFGRATRELNVDPSVPTKAKIFANLADRILFQRAIDEQAEINLFDRGLMCTVAYHAQGDEFRAEEILRFADDTSLNPDLTVLLIPPVSTCVERTRNRTDKDTFDHEAQIEKVHDWYCDAIAPMRRRELRLVSFCEPWGPGQLANTVIETIRRELELT